jgi:TctA family transporter
MDASVIAKKRRIRDAVLGGLLGIGGAVVAILLGGLIEYLFVPGDVISSRTLSISVLLVYGTLLVGYCLLAIRYRVLGLFAVLFHVLVWAWLPIELLIGLPI